MVLRKDMVQFIELIEKDKPDIKSLGIRGTSFGELIEVLKSAF